MQQNKEQTLAHFKTLGIIGAVVAHSKKFDALCILGATRSRIVERMQYAESFMAQGGKASVIIILGGERYAAVGAKWDGTEDELKALAEKYGLSDWHAVTETHIMQDAYSNSELRERGLAVHVINTLRGDLPLPTTQTTIMALIDWLREHPEVKKILFFSNQPYVLYQKAIIGAILMDQKVDVEFEVVGPAATQVNDMQPALEGLGAYLWAAAPAVLRSMGITIASEDLKRELEELYGKTPLLYKTIPFA